MNLVMYVVYAAAFVCEAVGITVAFKGFGKTWALFPRDEGLAATLAEPISKRAVRVQRFIKHHAVRLTPGLKSKDARVRVPAATGTASGGWTIRGSATGRARFGPLPAADDIPALRERIEAQFGVLQDQVWKAEEAASEERRERERKERELSDAFENFSSQNLQLTKRATSDGVRDQAYGLLLVLVGVALGTIGNLMQV